MVFVKQSFICMLLNQNEYQKWFSFLNTEAQSAISIIYRHFCEQFVVAVYRSQNKQNQAIKRKKKKKKANVLIALHCLGLSW